MSEDAWSSRAAAFRGAFGPIRAWVMRDGGVALPEQAASEEFGLVNLHAVLTKRRYLGVPVPGLPTPLLRPLARYLRALPDYMPDPLPGSERFSRAAREHFQVTTEQHTSATAIAAPVHAAGAP